MMLMATTATKLQKFMLYVTACKDGRFTIVLRPFHYWSQTVTKRPFLIVSQRSFATEARAAQEAAWLFGNVRWRRVGKALRAPVEFACRDL